MVKLKRFDIVFNNPERVYFAGQEMGGKVSKYNLFSNSPRVILDYNWTGRRETDQWDSVGIERSSKNVLDKAFGKI